MPKYFYRCTECNIESYFYHSVADRKEDCEQCNQKNTLTRLPSKFSLSKEKTEKKKVGDVVKKSIDDFTADLEEEKKRMKNVIWGADD